MRRWKQVVKTNTSNANLLIIRKIRQVNSRRIHRLQRVDNRCLELYRDEGFLLPGSCHQSFVE
jgi:hypothetical protein